MTTPNPSSTIDSNELIHPINDFDQGDITSSVSSDDELSLPNTEESSICFSDEITLLSHEKDESSTASGISSQSSDSTFSHEHSIFPLVPNNSPTAIEIPIASLINVIDDQTIVTDSHAVATHQGTKVSWASIGATPSSSHLGRWCQWTNRDFQSSASESSVTVEGDEANHVDNTLISSKSTVLTTPTYSTYTCSSLKKSLSFPPSSFENSRAITGSSHPQTRPSICDRSYQQFETRHAINSTTPLENLTGARAKSKIQEEVLHCPNKCLQKFNMCNDINPTKPSAGCETMSSTSRECSKTCAENFSKISKELEETKDKLFSLSLQMEDQASHIARLMEENRRYIQENGQLRKGRSRGGVAPADESYHLYNNGVYSDHHNNATTELEYRIMALKLQNSELNLCLEREKTKRKEAEDRMQKDAGYIKRLEDSVQNLRGTRVIMDKSTYQQVAEAYIATKGKPARRPHSHNHLPGSDLVCDGPLTNHNTLNPHRKSTLHQSVSCPSSPNSCPSPPHLSRQLYQPIESQEYPTYSDNFTHGQTNKNKSDRGHVSPDLNRGMGVSGSSMTQWDYQQLLHSLENLDGTNRGELS